LSRGSFDVIVGMDWLSKRKFVIVCHEKMVRIPLEGDETLQVHGERTQRVVKTLMNTKKRRVKLRRVRAMSMTIQSGVKDKILATLSETSKVENAPAEMLHDLDQQMEKRANDGCTLWIKLYSKYEYEIRYHPGRENVVIDALRRKERVKPRRVRAMAMTIQYGVRGMILAAQSEAFKQENGMMRMVVMDEAHASRFQDVKLARIHIDEIIARNGILVTLKLRFRWVNYLVVLADAAESVSDAIRFEYCLASSSGWTKSPILWVEIGESSLTRPELVLDMTNKVVLIKEKLKAARDHQKSYADNRPNVEFEIKVDKTLCFVEEPVDNSDCEVKSKNVAKGGS
ncbi:hypothetical protein Tco_1049354, partial [Tanacetum coccineum]